MELSQFQSCIKNNDLSPIYVLTGEEFEVMKIYINAISKPVLSCDTVDVVISQCGNKSLLEDSSKVFTVFEDLDFLKAENAWDKIKNILGKNTLILIYNTIDKRSKFYKHFKDNTIEFNKLPLNILTRYLKQQINLSDKYINDLINTVDGSYTKALLEIDKINNFTDKDNKDTAYLKLKSEGLIKENYNNLAINFMDALLSRNINKACLYGKLLKNSKESEIYVLAIVYNGFRQVLSVQGVKEKTDLTTKTGLNAWQVKQASQYLNYYSLPELKEKLLFIRKLETGVKIGKFSSECIIDLLICEILKDGE